MKIHKRTILGLPAATLAGKRGVNLRPGQALEVTATIEAAPCPMRRKLRVVGEVDLFWRWRHEGGMHLLYRSIADALDAAEAYGEKYSLKLAGNGEDWPRNAYMKVRITPAMRAAKTLTFAAMVKTAGLEFKPNGGVVVELGVYKANPARHADDISDLPDESVRLHVPAGTGNWRELSSQYVIKDEDVLLLVRVGGRGFKGVLWVGSPRLYAAGSDTVIPPFMPETAEENWRSVVWLGENLSRVEWPEFTLFVDGKAAGERKAVFQAMSRGGDFELELPELTAGEHTLKLVLEADYPTALPFNVWEVSIVEESARRAELIGYPEYIAKNEPFCALFETNIDGETSLAGIQVAFNAENADRFEVKVAGERFTLAPKRAVDTSGGDEILLSVSEHHIPQSVEAMESFLGWYVENQLGNAIGFRPIYTWTGTRQTNVEVWKRLVPVLTALRMRYFIIRDGRSLPGRAANPSDALLAGPSFLGRQTHERDGNYVYGAFKRQWNSTWGDLFRRPPELADDNLILAFKRMPVREGNKITRLHVTEAADMRQAARDLVDNLAGEKQSATRHTGPTTLFWYFYEAGYDWLGAETMYGPEEVLLCALRGASTAVGKTDFGAHLAMSWASAPHDTAGHAHRYFLSLATCYMQGVTHINLEDGLMRIDAEYAAHDVYSEACRIHREAHAKFRRFMQTHPRRGTMRVPIGVLQGRYCGWQSFYRETVFGSQRPDFKFGPAEESFDLLGVFFPRTYLEAIYRLNYFDDKPVGWYSGTPYGPVDITPLPAHGPLNQYKALAFLGWNTFEEEDFERLLAYVEQGGTLLLSKKHLSTHVVRNQAAALPRASAALEKLLGTVPLSGAKVTRQVGRGRVIYFPQDAYPCDASLRAAYEAQLHALGELAIESERARGWIAGTADVNFAAYDRPDGLRVIYLLNIDHWSAKQEAPAAFVWGEARYELAVPKGQIMVITVGAEVAVMTHEADADVMEIARRTVTVQSDAGVHLTVFEGGATRVVNTRRGGVETVVV